MNKHRREQLRGALRELNVLRNSVSLTKEEEDEARENRPDSFQFTEEYELSEESSDAMEKAVDHMDKAISYIAEAI